MYSTQINTTARYILTSGVKLIKYDFVEKIRKSVLKDMKYDSRKLGCVKEKKREIMVMPS